MSIQPTLNQIGKTTASGLTYLTSRMFVVEADPETGAEGYVVVYIAKDGVAVPAHMAKLVSFTRSRYPRREPHLVEVQTAEGETEVWECTLAGCGCGSPIKRVTWTTALKDYEASLEAQP